MSILPGLYGPTVLSSLQFLSGGFMIELEEEGGADDGDAGEGHGRRAHPWLHLQAEGREDAGSHWHAHQVIHTREQEVQVNSVHSLLGEIKAGNDIKEIIPE